MSTLAQKVDQASKYVLVPQLEVQENPVETIWSGLKELGILDDDISYEILMSKDCKEGDARYIFCDRIGIPVPRFKRIWSILKEGGKEEVSENSSSTLTSLASSIQALKPIGQYSNKDLLLLYAENQDDSGAEEELKKRSCGENCIAFHKDQIDVDLSVSLLAKAKRGIAVPTVMNKDGKIYRIYPVGKFPNETYDICPVTGEVLFEGYSEKLGVTWRVPLEVRQFIWLMSDQGIKIDTFVADNIQTIYEKEGLDSLRIKFTKIAALYDELKEVGELPKLKTNLSTKESKRLDPFGKINKRY